MKKITLLFLLITVTKSYGQFFENELNYLIFDKQDSLIKANKVKALKIEGFTFYSKAKKTNIDETKEYNEKGLLIVKNDNFYYSYDEFDRLEKKGYKESRRLRKGIKREQRSYKKDLKSGGNKKLIHGDLLLKAIYEYDTLHRLKKEERYLNSGHRFKNEYTYNIDTIKVISFHNDKIKNVKKLTQTSNSKTVLSIHLIGITDYYEKLLDEKKLMLVEKHFRDKEMRYSKTYFMDTDYKILKKATIRPRKTFNRELNVWEQYNTKDFCSYVYNEKKELIEKKELLKPVSGVEKKYYNMTKFNYYDSGLLKEITVLRKDYEEKDYKEISFKQYNYQFHN